MFRDWRKGLTALLGSASLAGPAGAEIVAAGEGGFTVVHRVSIAAPKSRVYWAAIDDISLWWDPAHTVTGKSENLRIDERPLGCFCESLGTEGAGVVHMTVTFVSPGAMLRLSGGLGPLGLLGVSGNFTWEFTGADDGTSEVTWTYAVGGFFPEGTEDFAPAVDRVLAGQLERLRSHIESGFAGDGAP